MEGTDKIKELLVIGYEFGKKVADNLEDGKISIWEGIGMVPDIFKVIGEVKQWPAIKAQLDDLTPDEMVEIENFIMEKYNIPNEKVKAVIKHAIGIVISIISLVNEIKHIKD